MLPGCEACSGPISDTGRHLGGRAGDEALVEAGELVRHDVALDHLEAASLGELDHRLAGDAVEEAVGVGVWISPSLMKNTLAPVPSATWPRQSSISASA